MTLATVFCFQFLKKEEILLSSNLF
jgi:hypothetical protein